MPTEKNKLNLLVNELDKRVEDAQQAFLLQGKELIGSWLRSAKNDGQFELAVDWLMGNGADRYFNSNREILAVIAARDAIQLFEIRDGSTENIYQDVRDWFAVS